MKNRETYLSLARVVCAFAVVMIHTNGCFYEFNIERCWGLANVIECGLGFAVPIFLMITGATLIDYSERYSTKEYFKRRVEKVVIPYLFWGIFICSIYSNITGRSDLFMIYYFFMYLFGIYLCIPLFSFVKKEYKEKIFLYLVLISFVVNTLIPFLCEVFGWNYVLKVPFEVASGFLIYPLQGYLIHKNSISLKWRMVIYVLSVLGFGLHIVGTYFASIDAGEIVDIFRGYTNVPCVLSAVGVFVLLKQIGAGIKNEKIIHAIEILSSYTFSIYLIHWYIIYFFIRVIFTDTHSLLYKIGTPFLTYAICIGIAWIIRKIPVVRKLLP